MEQYVKYILNLEKVDKTIFNVTRQNQAVQDEIKKYTDANN